VISYRGEPDDETACANCGKDLPRYKDPKSIEYVGFCTVSCRKKWNINRERLKDVG
jgi:hypothetical protein